MRDRPSRAEAPRPGSFKPLASRASQTDCANDPFNASRRNGGGSTGASVRGEVPTACLRRRRAVIPRRRAERPSSSWGRPDLHRQARYSDHVVEVRGEEHLDFLAWRTEASSSSTAATVSESTALSRSKNPGDQSDPGVSSLSRALRIRRFRLILRARALRSTASRIGFGM